jgi:hypothetical protein
LKIPIAESDLIRRSKKSNSQERTKDNLHRKTGDKSDFLRQTKKSSSKGRARS